MNAPFANSRIRDDRADFLKPAFAKAGLFLIVIVAIAFLACIGSPSPDQTSRIPGKTASSTNPLPHGLSAVAAAEVGSAHRQEDLVAALGRGDKTAIEAALTGFASSTADLSPLLSSLSDDALNRAVPVLAALDPGQFGACGNQLVMEAVRRLAEDERLPSSERRAALVKLEKAWHVTPDLIQTAVRVACENEEEALRLAAIAAMAAWMDNNPYLSETLTPDLLRICDAESSHEVRDFATQTLAVHCRQQPKSRPIF